MSSHTPSTGTCSMTELAGPHNIIMRPSVFSPKGGGGGVQATHGNLTSWRGKVKRGRNLTFTRYPGMGDLTLASLKMWNPLSLPTAPKLRKTVDRHIMLLKLISATSPPHETPYFSHCMSGECLQKVSADTTKAWESSLYLQVFLFPFLVSLFCFVLVLVKAVTKSLLNYTRDL